jgi:hypothetical protein
MLVKPDPFNKNPKKLPVDRRGQPRIVREIPRIIDRNLTCEIQGKKIALRRFF